MSELNNRKNDSNFGYKKVDKKEKGILVGNVFTDVAGRYDIFNDIASVGLHRIWKKYAVWLLNAKSSDVVLDIASGTGDLALEISKTLLKKEQLWMTDVNFEMLSIGRQRCLDLGKNFRTVLCNAETLPFRDCYFDKATIAFGLRNFTDRIAALKEISRVLKPGGKLLVLEFSKIEAGFGELYDWYLSNLLPQIGSLVVGKEDPYQYLVESIKTYPNPMKISSEMNESGFSAVRYQKVLFGAVSIHQAFTSTDTD